MNDTHEIFREWLALRLYGELDAEETQSLDVHLAECEACRAYEQELAVDLGSIPTMAASQEASDVWLARVRDATRRADSWWASRQTWVASVLSFAAGIVLMMCLQGSGTDDRSSAPETRAERSRQEPFVRATPPPPATARAPFAAMLGSR